LQAEAFQAVLRHQAFVGRRESSWLKKIYSIYQAVEYSQHIANSIQRTNPRSCACSRHERPN
jgi:hypothetical protein